MSSETRELVNILGRSRRHNHKMFNFTDVVNNERKIMRRDASKFDQGYQLQRIRENVDKLSRRIVKAAKLGDTARVQHLARMLANSQGKAMVIIDTVERLAAKDEPSGQETMADFIRRIRS